MRVSFHPGAEQDLNEAIDYYNARQIGSGERFLDAVDSILQDPDRMPVVCDGTECGGFLMTCTFASRATPSGSSP